MSPERSYTAKLSETKPDFTAWNSLSVLSKTGEVDVQNRFRSCGMHLGKGWYVCDDAVGDRLNNDDDPVGKVESCVQSVWETCEEFPLAIQDSLKRIRAGPSATIHSRLTGDSIRHKDTC